MKESLAFAALYMAFLALPSAQSCSNHTQVKHDLQELTEMNAQMMLQIEEIARDIDAMKNPQKVEHIIRDELGYGRKNDLTLVF